MSKLKSLFRFFITKVSTPLPVREGLGVGLFLLLVCSCGPGSHEGRVKGKIEGINQADIQAFIEDTVVGVSPCADTIHIKKGSFSYDREITEPTILTLLYPNFSSTSVVIEPGKTVKLRGDANRLGEIEVDGNDDNNLLTEFRRHTLGKRDAEVQREAATFIRTRAKTMAATVLFRDYFANAEVVESNPAESLLAELVKAQPRSAVVQTLAKRVRPLLATAPGKPLPTFSGPDINGGTVSSADYRGKNTLIVFCAQWDASFYMMKRYARELNSNVGAGQLSFIFITLDTDKQAFLSANSFDPLPGKVIFDGKALSSPLVTKLGMRYVAGSLLVGADGKIKARDIPCEDWADRIPGLL